MSYSKLEQASYEVADVLEGDDGRVNGKIRLVNANGDTIASLPTLPTADGIYGIEIEDGVVSWVELDLE